MAKGILVITGPTASGKTALGVRLAKELNGEVISADAMQLYRGMVIGTAAPTAEEMQGVPHRLIGTVDPRESYSVGRYVAEASAAADDILARGKLPLLVGGTNLYIEALLRGTAFAGGDPEVRRRLEAEYDEAGGGEMLARLRAVDPERASKLHPNDRKRVVRALEIFAVTGKTISRFDAESREAKPRYDSVTVALSWEDRGELYRRMSGSIAGEIRLGYLHRNGETRIVSGGSVSGQMAEVIPTMEFSSETEQYDTCVIPRVTRLKGLKITGVE